MTHSSQDTLTRVLGSRWTPDGPTVRETIAARDAADRAAAIAAELDASGNLPADDSAPIGRPDDGPFGPPAAQLEERRASESAPGCPDPWGDARSAREGSR